MKRPGHKYFAPACVPPAAHSNRVENIKRITFQKRIARYGQYLKDLRRHGNRVTTEDLLAVFAAITRDAQKATYWKLVGAKQEPAA